jgi:hypothetical protein
MSKKKKKKKKVTYLLSYFFFFFFFKCMWRRKSLTLGEREKLGIEVRSYLSLSYGCITPHK